MVLSATYTDRLHLLDLVVNSKDS